MKVYEINNDKVWSEVSLQKSKSIYQNLNDSIVLGFDSVKNKRIFRPNKKLIIYYLTLNMFHLTKEPSGVELK